MGPVLLLVDLVLDLFQCYVLFCCEIKEKLHLIFDFVHAAAVGYFSFEGDRVFTHSGDRSKDGIIQFAKRAKG